MPQQDGFCFGFWLHCVCSICCMLVVPKHLTILLLLLGSRNLFLGPSIF